MTVEEAELIAGVLIFADGGCHICAGELAKGMQGAFPEFDWPELVKEAAERHWSSDD